jgi:hypothetical protein
MVLSRHYTIIVRGRLGERFESTFPNASLSPDQGQTRLDTGLLDQSQLHGLLEQLRSFAMELISLEAAESPHGPEPHSADIAPIDVADDAAADSDDAGRP